MSLLDVNPAGKTSVSPLTGGPDGFQLSGSLQRLKKDALPVQVRVRAVETDAMASSSTTGPTKIGARAEPFHSESSRVFMDDFLFPGFKFHWTCSKTGGPLKFDNRLDP